MINLQVQMPHISILELVWKKLFAYIMACPCEIGGLGSVERDGDDLIITDVFLLDQVTSTSRMTLDPQAVQRFVVDWVMEQKNPEVLRFWWHSHADMEVFWSHIDESTIQSLAAKDALSDQSYFVSVVGNRLGQLKARLTVSHPIPIDVDDIPLVVIPDLETVSEFTREVEVEVAQKVRASSYFDEMLDEFAVFGDGFFDGLSGGLASAHLNQRYVSMMRRKRAFYERKQSEREGALARVEEEDDE